MSKAVAGRYELEYLLPTGQSYEAWRAADLQSRNDDRVLVYLVNNSRRQDLLHDMLVRRSRALSQFHHPMLIPLRDYGYCQQNEAYYFVYPDARLARLTSYLDDARPGLVWSIDVLLELSDMFCDMHGAGIVHGSFSAEDVYLDVADPEKLGVYVNRGGLRPLLALALAADMGNHVGGFEHYLRNDVEQLHIAARYLVGGRTKLSEDVLARVIEDQPLSVREGLQELLTDVEKGEQDTALSFRRRVDRVRRALALEETYYIRLTKWVVEKLSDYGLIPEQRDYLAYDFLNKELERGVVAWCEAGQGKEPSYRLTTAQLRLFCVPENQPDPPPALVATGAALTSRSDIMVDHQIGLLLPYRLQVGPPGRVPASADVTPLLKRIDAHVQSSVAIKNADQKQNNRFSQWEAVVEQQQRLTKAFKVQYIDLRVILSESIIVVKLAKPLDENGELTQDTVLRLSTRSGHSQMAGYFEKVDEDELIIGIAGGVDSSIFADRGHITVDNVQLETMLRRQREAMRRLKYGETVNSRLPEILTNAANAGLGVDNAVPITAWRQSNLDASQRKAVQWALAAQDLFLIQGPPGTGKTSVIAELVLQILARDPLARILISSQSNVAVNHAVNKIVELEPDLISRVVRIGREEKAGTAEALLLERQMERWSEAILQRSASYMDSWKQTAQVDAQASQAMALVEEIHASAERVKARQQEMSQSDIQLEHVEGHYRELDRAFGEVWELQRKAEALLQSTGSVDVDMERLLKSFQSEYLGWAASFLERAEETSHLSVERAAIKARIVSLEAEIDRLEDEILTGKELVNDFLNQKFNVSFESVEGQKVFLEREFAALREELVRLGRVERMLEGWRLQASRNWVGLSSAYLSQCNVVGATCIGVAARGEIGDAKYDWVIIDEAGRATHPELLVPMIRGKKIVLVGDHLQLPPTIDQHLEKAIEIEGLQKRDLEKSLFQDLWEQSPGEVRHTLDVQYRMHPAIGALIGQCFYGGSDRLKPGNRAEDRAHGLTWCPRPIVWYSTAKTSGHRETPVGTSYLNQVEQEIIVELLDRINATYKREGSPAKSVGVITGYLPQRDALRHRIRGERDRWLLLSQIDIDTVDAYQGQERDIVIYSVVRSNDQGKIGFLKDSRRLNVALSRAKDLVMIVGDPAIRHAQIRGQNPFFDVLEYIRAHPDAARLEDLV